MRAVFLDGRAEAHPLELADAVGRQIDAGADFAERGCLLVDRNIDVLCGVLGDQCVRRKQAANSTADDHNVEFATSPSQHLYS